MLSSPLYMPSLALLQNYFVKAALGSLSLFLKHHWGATVGHHTDVDSHKRGSGLALYDCGAPGRRSGHAGSPPLPRKLPGVVSL
jgi:hypothetical protein